MATNDFLPFATGVGANVLSQTDYAALPAVSSGYQSGIAKSQQLNKTWRQSSIMAAVLAQFIADETGVNSTDDGTTATLLANLKNATPGRLLRITKYSGGTFTWTKGTGTTAIRVRLVGCGGSGGGAPATGASQVSIGSGGSSGSFAEGYYTGGSVPSSATVTTPSGPAGNTGSAGANGSAASFGSLMTAPGGVGGTIAGPSVPPFSPSATGNGGAPTGGNLIATPGAWGGYAFALASGSIAAGGGGSSVVGGGGPPVGSGAAGAAAVGAGGGGGGTAQIANSAALTGGQGGGAFCIVEEYGSI